MDQESFTSGFIAGFLMAGVLGYLFQQVRLKWKQFRGGYTPQKVEHKTGRSPSQVMSASLVGCLLTLLFLALIGGAVAVAYYFYVASFG